MAELRTFFVNPSKIPDEPLEIIFAHCAHLPRNDFTLKKNEHEKHDHYPLAHPQVSHKSEKLKFFILERKQCFCVLFHNHYYLKNRHN